MKLTSNIFVIVIILILYSCKGFLEIDPPKDRITTNKVFINDAIATSAVTGIYSRMSLTTSTFSGSVASIAVLNGLSSDELRSYNLSLDDFYRNELISTNARISSLWTDAYAYIYSANSILEGLELQNGVTENTSKQLRGEAKFIRGFCYFYLINLFGNVPLNLTTDYRINEVAGKVPKEIIYDQIVKDLSDAEELLSTNYITSERIRPNKWVAKALLSRVYLYIEKWELASLKATEVIDQKPMYTLVDDLDKVFLKNSSEAIWQIMPASGNNTNEGSLFILTSTPVSVSLSNEFISLFQTNDNRKVKWVNEYSNVTGKYYYPYKYKIRTTINNSVDEYSMVIRLAEMYLIRAEARVKLSQTSLALEDINLIRKRAGLAFPLEGLNSDQCIQEIERQRQLEFFTEWGHRWLDLKRTGRASDILGPIKGNTWKNSDILYPIPESEISRNPNINQNFGY